MSSSIKTPNTLKRPAEPVRLLLHAPLVCIALMLAVCATADLLFLKRPLMLLPIVPIGGLWVWSLFNVFQHQGKN